MIQITKRLTQLVWYGPTAAINTLPWRLSTALIRAINAGGTGFVSYNPALSLNSLSNITTGQIIEVDALPAAFADPGFAIDNGTPPNSAGAGSVQLVATFPAGKTSAVPMPVLFAAEPGTYDLDAANPVVGVTNLSYAKAGVAVNLPVTLAAGEVLVATATAATGQDGRIVLLKQ